MAKRTNAVQMVTPVGVAVYPHVHAPDTKFNEGGVYTTKLSLDAEVAAPLISKLEKIREGYREEAKKLAKGKKVKDADLPYAEQEDGSVVLGFKKKASGTRQDGTPWKAEPPVVVDAKLQTITGVKLGGGSRIRVSFLAEPFYTAMVGLGVTLRLVGIQVLDLKTWGEQTPEAMGFAAEDGFTAEDSFGGAGEDDEEEEEDAEDDDEF